MSSNDLDTLVSVTDVRVVSRYIVELDFDNGERRVVDLEEFLWGPMFAGVRSDYAQFQRVRIEGGTVAWPNGADLSPDLLYAKSKPLFDVELSPMSHKTGIVYLDSVELDAEQELNVGDRVELRDEGGTFHAATVLAKREARYGGYKHTLKIEA